MSFEIVQALRLICDRCGLTCVLEAKKDSGPYDRSLVFEYKKTSHVHPRLIERWGWKLVMTSKEWTGEIECPECSTSEMSKA